MAIADVSSRFPADLCRLSRFGAVLLFGLALAGPLRVAAAQQASSSSRASMGSPWVATWGAAMRATPPGTAPDFSGQTLRQIVHTSVDGQQVRVWFSNRFGDEPLHIGAAHIALSGNAGSDRTLTFHHLTSVTIPPGATIVSDAATMGVPAFSNVAVSVYFPGCAMGTTEHNLALQTSYSAPGSVVEAASLGAVTRPVHAWYFLTGVDVYAPGDSAVVTMGDSITDGDHSSPGENHRWPDFLAARLAADPGTRDAGVLGVANAGLDGNRVLLNGWGPDAVSRIDRDILARSGARYLILLESINDIGLHETNHQPYGDLAERLEAGLAQIAAQAHQHGIRVFGATLTPYLGSEYYSAAGDTVRQAVNRWIRSTRVFDGVIEFDKTVRDPRNPLRYAPQYDSGDHLHPNDAGYKAMADAVDLSLFTKQR